MAVLPVPYTSVGLPWALSEDENIEFLESANNTPQSIRHGGHRFSLPLELVPVFMVNDAATAAEIDVFLAANVSFEIPLINMPASTNSGTWTVDGAHSIGDTTIDLNVGTGDLQPGQFIRFGTKKKVYRVRSWASPTVTLTKPLRQDLSDLDAVVYTGTDGKSNNFNGVLGEFMNKDFGSPSYTVDEELVARFGPFRLVETLA